MRIYQVFDSYPLFYQPYLPPLIEALRDKGGLNVKIVAFRGEKARSNEVIFLPKYIKRKVLAKLYHHLNKKFQGLDYLEINLLKKKIDIVHVQHSFLFPKVINLLNLSKEIRPKVVITLRGGDTYIKPWVSEKWKRFYNDYGDKVDAFIVMSEDQKKYLRRWGVPLENIHVIPISFGTQFFIEPKVANKDALRLVSVFRMCWEKNIADGLRFVRSLKEMDIPFVYDVYGDGPDLGQVYYLRDKYDLNKEVNILGKTYNKELKQKFVEYDFILQLSHSESLGMSVIEALSFGIPAIVSGNGGLPEVVQNGVNGVMVNLKNIDSGVKEVVSIWNNESVYRKMSQNSIKHAHQNFATESEVAKLIELYLKIA